MYLIAVMEKFERVGVIRTSSPASISVQLLPPREAFGLPSLYYKPMVI